MVPQHTQVAILPKYLRRALSLDAVIPALYLKGISTGNFQEALEAMTLGAIIQRRKNLKFIL